jgi:hypothetical protein
VDVAAGAEERAGASTAVSELVSPRLFWALLAVAVVALIGMIVRLARRAEPVQSRDASP